MSSKAMYFEPAFTRGQIVYLKTDTEGQPYQVVGYVIDYVVRYKLQCMGMITEHEEFEIMADMDAALLEELGEEDDDEEDFKI